jgi:hypothetical protein
MAPVPPTDGRTLPTATQQIEKLKERVKEQVKNITHTASTTEARRESFVSTTSVSVPLRMEVKAQQQAEELRERVEANKERTDSREQQYLKRQAVWENEQQERIAAYRERLTSRYHAAVDRLSLLADRVQSRIEKEGASGVDGSDASRILAEARRHIEAARDSLVAETVARDDIDTVVKTITTTFTYAKGELELAKEILTQSVAALKQQLSATSSPAIETN